MTINVLGAGAFGTSLAIAMAGKEDVVLWARSDTAAAEMTKHRENTKRLCGYHLPENVTITAKLDEIDPNGPCLVAIPMQQLADFVDDHHQLLSRHVVIACCKGIDLTSDLGPVGVLNRILPADRSGILSGPSFAADLAAGLPTALTLAMANPARLEAVQQHLSTQQIRLYSTTDWRGVELGGALKNVMAIACGVVEGAQLGESARAAILTRGFAEMRNYASLKDANPDTLLGLSGLGDLTLTASSVKSRNFRFGVALGSGIPWNSDETVEGAATAQAVAAASTKEGLDLPLTQIVAALVEKKLSVEDALQFLVARPLRKET